jgi:hypothetical protein
VIDEYNGLLVENYNAINLAAALTVWFGSRVVKKKCSQSVAHLSLETISKQWESIH